MQRHRVHFFVFILFSGPRKALLLKGGWIHAARRRLNPWHLHLILSDRMVTDQHALCPCQLPAALLMAASAVHMQRKREELQLQK
jgi:hypothetical protein